MVYLRRTKTKEDGSGETMANSGVMTTGRNTKAYQRKIKMSNIRRKATKRRTRRRKENLRKGKEKVKGKEKGKVMVMRGDNQVQQTSPGMSGDGMLLLIRTGTLHQNQRVGLRNRKVHLKVE